MGDNSINDIISHLDPAMKKELLNSLVISLLDDLMESEKRELLQMVAAGGRKNRHVIEMVDR
jgi:hypothetical protein